MPTAKIQPAPEAASRARACHDNAERLLRRFRFQPLRQIRPSVDERHGPGELFEVWRRDAEIVIVHFYGDGNGVDFYRPIPGGTWSQVADVLGGAPAEPAPDLRPAWRPNRAKAAPPRELKPRVKPVRDLTPAECRALLVHAHECSTERRRAYLLRGYCDIAKAAGAPYGMPHFTPEEAAQIDAWIAKEETAAES